MFTVSGLNFKVVVRFVLCWAGSTELDAAISASVALRLGNVNPRAECSWEEVSKLSVNRPEEVEFKMQHTGHTQLRRSKSTKFNSIWQELTALELSS